MFLLRTCGEFASTSASGRRGYRLDQGERLRSRRGAGRRTLAAEGVERLATGSFEEAVAVREAGVGLPILMLPAALPSGIGHLLRHDLTPTVCDLDAARAVSAADGGPHALWVKVESGLGRLGVPLPEAPRFLRSLAELPNLAVEGIYTHLPFGDAEGREWVVERLRAFRALLDTLDRAGLLPPITQALSSAGILAGLDDGCSAVCPGHSLTGSRRRRPRSWTPRRSGRPCSRSGQP